MPPPHGLAILQAASLAITQSSAPQSSAVPPAQGADKRKARSAALAPRAGAAPAGLQDAGSGAAPCSSLSALLNPAPPGQTLPPHGFVLGKDGKLKKKRGRKPTPGLTDEDRRQARLLKNRRTAETSRRRKLALLNKLTLERDEAVEVAERLKIRNAELMRRLAAALGTSVAELEKEEVGSDVSGSCSVVDSDSDCTKKV